LERSCWSEAEEFGTIDMKNILSLVDVGLDNFILPKDWVFFAFSDQIPQLNQGILVFFKVQKLSTYLTKLYDEKITVYIVK
ncbi:hypothetical protein, partial [Caldalkalibacillus thermarum]|uniref:hypothetical protein n=1 Tax=Caldalkalibacillus thermarum TaxID=296745 RepID=UPI001E2F5A3E